MVRVIKTEEEYENALDEISTLIDRDPDPGSSEADRLELLTLLVETYESHEFPKRKPDPLEAIRFRMEQQGLKQRDLIPFIGSASKVSEILSGKRTLTLSMMRALHSHLGIPATVLLYGGGAAAEDTDEVEWNRFPVKEMDARGWFNGGSIKRDKPERLLRAFFARIGSPMQVAALLKRTDTTRSARSLNAYALTAWKARIINRAAEQVPKAAYKSESVDLKFMSEVAQLSWSSTGPRLAQEFLRQHGIPLIIEPHLSHTHLDGAVIMEGLDRPIIGMTIRHDRIDNFWYCLMHELAHISLHYGQGFTHFFDSFDLKESKDRREQEADKLAQEALIPKEEWNKSPAKSLPSPEAAEHLAKKLRIHPAIVAGRIRHEARSYKILSQMVGQGRVRSCFKDVTWSEP
jgi:HTH-type transcriptional regulator / antitoxin HigA